MFYDAKKDEHVAQTEDWYEQSTFNLSSAHAIYWKKNVANRADDLYQL